jgi:iron complex transport system permease protein
VKRYTIYLLLLAVMLLVVFIADLWLAGTSIMSFSEFSFDNYIFSNIRFPKALTALLCGISLPVAGQILQVLFRNPLAGPYVLGISSSSSFFVALALMFFGGNVVSGNYLISKTTLVLFSFAGSLLCTLIILSVSGKVKNNVFLLLIGLMMGQIFGALQSFLEYYSTNESLREFTLWGFGSLGNSSSSDILLFGLFTLTLSGLMLAVQKPFQLFLLGENYAKTLGIPYYRYRFLFLIISSLLTAVATAFCGPIAFIGLSVPIMTRLLFSTAGQHVLMLAGVLIGAIVMLLCDIIGHVFISGQIIPINIITTLIGSPFIIYLLFKNKTW